MSKSFEYPKEMQEKIDHLEAYMIDWVCNCESLGEAYEGYDEEKKRHAKIIGLKASEINNHILTTKDFALCIDKTAKLISIPSFLNAIKDGSIMQDDGKGYYATNKEVSDIPAYVKMFEKGLIRKDFTHVAWSNR